MPNRYIRESAIESEAVNSLSWQAEVFWRRLLNRADDFGRFTANPALLRASIFPLQLDCVSEADVQRLLAECEAAGLLFVYSSSCKRFIILNKWEKGRAKESKYPPPDDDTIKRMQTYVYRCSHMSPTPTPIPTPITDSDKRQAPPAGDAGLPLPGLNQNLATSDGQHDTFPVPGPENPAAAKETAKDAKPAEVQGVTLPAELETEAFRAAWADWLAYRRECKVSKYKPRAMAAQLATLAEWGHDVAVESIRQSIRQQWRGLFEPKASFGSAQGVSAESKKRSDKIAKTNGYEY
mgnify:CR=1 FL=1